MSPEPARREPGPADAPVDLVAYRQTVEELRRSEAQFRAVVANIPGVVYRCACDANWTMRFMSASVEDLTGYPLSDFIENRVRSWGSIIHPDDRGFVIEGIEQALEDGSPYSLQYRLFRSDGTACWIAEHGRAVLGADGERQWLDGVILDVTEHKLAEHARDRAEAQLRHQAELSRHEALHDTLTGLPNRTLFDTRARDALARARLDGSELGLLMIDLDRFKEVNDTLGHPCGDRLLVEVGRRLQATVREGDSIARLGGDEFAMLLVGASAVAVLHAVERIRSAISQPLVIDELPLQLEASVGIALYPAHSDDATELSRRADIALYAAKHGHSGYAVYQTSAGSSGADPLTLVGELRRALDERELVLHYQPKLELATGLVTGVEALVRWQHPVRGLLMPAAFIPFAQETSLMRPLTLYVIDEALRQCALWCSSGRRLPVAVNVSTRNLIDVEFPDEVAMLLDARGVEPGLLALDIAETAIVADLHRATTVLRQLAELGVRLAIDDFGTGYFSLAYLKRLPISELKIDRSLVASVGSSADDAAIVRCTVDVGRTLGLGVVAEGVESSEVCRRLERLGCDTAQGYYLSRPLPPDELTAWLEQHPPEWSSTDF